MLHEKSLASMRHVSGDRQRIAGPPQPKSVQYFGHFGIGYGQRITV